MYYTVVRDGKKGKMEKEDKINHSILVFFPKLYLALLKVYCIQNLKTLALIGAENSVTEIFIGEEEKLDK